MTKHIYLTGKKYPGLVATVDDEDYEYINRWKWFAAGESRSKNYPEATVLYAVRTQWDAGHYRKIRMHKVIMDTDARIDHIDHDGLNNVRSNLRVAQHDENMRNRKPPRNNTSGYVGVQRDTTQSLKRGIPMWRATITIDGRLKVLASFADPKEAALCRDAATRKYYGGYGYLNFPESE